LAPPSTTIVRSLVDDIIIPPIGVITGGVDFSSIFIPLNGEHYSSLAAAKQAGAPTINIGLFINNVISFLIVTFVLFMVIKAMNQLRRGRGPGKRAAALARGGAADGDQGRTGKAELVPTR
jgi:large conductance mechanosensitive channel protein